MKWARLLIIPGVFFVACTSDFFNDLDKIGSSYWDPELGLPVVGSTFTIEDYVNAVSGDVTVSQDADGVVVFEYQGEDIKSDFAEDMITVPKQTFNASIGFGAAEASGFPVNLTLTKSENFNFVVDTEDADVLDSMVFKSGILNIDIAGDFPVSGQLDIIFNPIRINNQPFSRSYSWTYDPNNPGQSFVESVDLSGAFVDYTNGGTQTNNFNFDIVLTINYAGQAISAANKVDINLTMDNPKFRIVYGKFAQRQFVTNQQSVLLGILDKVEAVDFYLDDPQIDFNFKSSFGLPVLAKMSSLEAINANGDILPFTGSVITTATSVASPQIADIGSFIETNININKDNSNITDIIAFLPSELSYQFEGSVEPQDPLIEQFVMDTSQVIGSYVVKLPLSGRVANFSSNKDFDFDGSSLDPLKETKVILHTSNGLPLTVAVELVFLDANDMPIDTLFSGTNLLSAGELDTNGLVVAAADNSIEEVLTAEEIEQLKPSKKIRMLSTMHTGLTGTENVKIRMQDEVKVNVYIQTKLAFKRN